MPASSPTIRYDLRDGVATVTLHRPDAMNALDTELKVALRDTLAAAAEDPGVRVVVLTGSGKAFCVGQDLAEHARNLSGGDVDAVWTTVPEHYTPIATLLATMPKPVVAAVNGVAAGAGAAFAFACDFRIVADTAGFNMAFAAVGLSADSGSTWSLPRLVGVAKAKELLLTPSTITADAGARAGARDAGGAGRRAGQGRGRAGCPARRRPHGCLRRDPAVGCVLGGPRPRRVARARGGDDGADRCVR